MAITHSIIEAITPLPRDPNMRRIRVGKKTVASLRAADVEQLKLEVGQTWTASRAAAVEHAVASQKARKAAFTMLGRRAFSLAEMEQRLAHKGHEQAIAQQIVKELAADRWIDDAAFAADVVAHEKRKGVGSKDFIRAKLQSHQIDDGVAHTIADESLHGHDAVANAIALVRRRLGNMSKLPPHKAGQRIASLLARRGFEEDVVQEVLIEMGVLAEE